MLDTKAQAGTNIMPAPINYLGRDAKDMKYRYNWNAPIIWSRYEPNTFYHGAQVLIKTTDLGKTWKEVSPDLTRNEKEKQETPGVPYTNEAVGAENYGTLAYVVESPHEHGVIWTGSDDGLVQLTRDGGATWKNVTPKGLAECLINAIEVSPFDKATAYIATTRYKFNDHRPASTRPRTTARPGQASIPAFPPMPSPGSCGRTTSAATCCSRGPSSASSFRGTAGSPGRRSSSTCRSRRSPTCGSTRAT